MSISNNTWTPSSREFAMSICHNLQLAYGADVAAIFLSQSLTEKEKITNCSNILMEAIFLQRHNEGNNEFILSEEFDKEFSLTSSEIDIEPNIAISQKDAKYLSKLEGEDVKTYLFNLTKRFENMSNAKTPGALVAEMTIGSVIAVGVPMAVEVYKAYSASVGIRAAMLSGVKGVGMKTAIGAVVIVLASLLLYLFLENPKKILGMVINDTDYDLVVKDFDKEGGDLLMVHGHMVDFMQDNRDGLGSDKVQLKQRFIFDDSPEESFVMAGIYFADRNFGLRGAEGIMAFSSLDSELNFVHMFAVPYSKDNRTNVRLLDEIPGDLNDLYRTLYDENKVRVDFKTTKYRMTSTVNNSRGGVVGCIAYVGRL